MKSPFIRVLLAISPDHLEKHFKDTLIYGNREYGAKFEICPTVAKERQFLDEIIQIEQPEIVIYHELLHHSFDLYTDNGKEQNERDILEMVER